MTAKLPILHLSEKDELAKDTIGLRDLSMKEKKSIVLDIKQMSNSSNMKGVIENLDSQRKQQKFSEKIEIILKQFECIKLDKDDERMQLLFLFTMQSANDYLQNDDKKDEICLQLLKQLVNDDEYLTKNIMNIVKSKVKPLTYYRRYKHNFMRLSVFFSRMFSRAT